VVAKGAHLIFDTSPEFRLQVIESNVPRVDAVFLTHDHADHVFGFDDIRRFCAMQDADIPVYGSPKTIGQMRTIFGYADRPAYAKNAVPRVAFTEMDATVTLGNGVRVTPLPVQHGAARIYAYLVDDGDHRLVYAPDCNGIPAETLAQIGCPDVMILDALRPAPHQTHFSLAESLAVLAEIGAVQSFVTHLTHENDHAALQAVLPSGITVPFDGLSIEL
jgi:phosphoribosyl 1,2-cyclic phosphate phosphodiesterase